MGIFATRARARKERRLAQLIVSRARRFAAGDRGASLAVVDVKIDKLRAELEA